MNSSVRIARPELGCRISLDIQTQISSTHYPFKKVKETQVIVLSLESLPLPFSSHPSTPSPASPFYSPPKPFLDVEQESDIGLGSGSGLDFGVGVGRNEVGVEKEEKGRGKVYTCFKWNTVRVLGVSFCWGADFLADVDVSASALSKRGRCGLIRRVLRSWRGRRGKGERAMGLSGLETGGRGGEEGKPLLV